MHVTAPASSANLGPGYDCLGVALPLRNDVVVERSSGPLEVVLLGEGADELPADATNLVMQSFRRSSGLTGDGLRFTLTNRVPLRSGTGSSSAAIVAGLAAGLAFTDHPVDVETLLPLAIEIEGHPDNVAAAILGGFTIALGGEPPLARRIAPPAGLGFVLVVPTDTLCTQESRKALRTEIPRADAVYSLQRSALLVDLLATGRARAAAARALRPDARARSGGADADARAAARARRQPAVLRGDALGRRARACSCGCGRRAPRRPRRPSVPACRTRR